MKFPIIILFLILLANQSYSQKEPAKFGDISVSDLQMNRWQGDTSAAAVVLVDYGECKLEYNQSKGFQVVFERLRRIKVFKKDGLEWGDFSIRTYQQNDTEEKLSGLKAVTYNLENGKIVESKLKSDAIFRTKIDKNHEATTFSVPNLKEGAIIEYTYKITSDFLFNFQVWDFQTSIPVALSEFRASFPEYFHYDKYTQGYVGFEVNDLKQVPATITLNSSERTTGRNGTVTGTQFHTDNLRFNEYRYRWVARNVPAFKPEPYLTTARDYISRISFELAYTAFPQQPIKHYMGTWSDINKFYYEHSDFGGEVRGNGFLKKIADELTAGLVSPEEKIFKLQRYISGNIEWNGVSTDFSSSVLRKAFDEKKGNSAEINLLLASLLDKAGFDVSPVLISTRDHGFIREQIPISTQFNYVLCLVKFNDKKILLDATEPLLPPQVLPHRCLNGKGLVVSKNGPSWLDVASSIRTRTLASFSVKLTPDGNLQGNLSLEYTGYDALNQRKNYISKGEDEFIKSFKQSRDWDVSKGLFENVKDLSLPFKQKYDIEISSHAVKAGDVLFINPFLALHKAANPFKLEKREYPVDFGYPQDEVYMLKIEIPDGYVVDELPKSKILMLPENGAKYVFNASLVGNSVMITSTFQMNKNMFSQIEYPNLREYYNQVVAKQAEQIVLKKKI